MHALMAALAVDTEQAAVTEMLRLVHARAEAVGTLGTCAEHSLPVDPRLLTAAMKELNVGSEIAAIELALKEVVRQAAARRILARRGTIEYFPGFIEEEMAGRIDAA